MPWNVDVTFFIFFLFAALCSLACLLLHHLISFFFLFLYSFFLNFITDLIPQATEPFLMTQKKCRPFFSAVCVLLFSIFFFCILLLNILCVFIQPHVRKYKCHLPRHERVVATAAYSYKCSVQH